MKTGEILGKIRPYWLNIVSSHLASKEGVRANFEEQLDRFFDLLQQSVDCNQPDLINPIILAWVRAPTETELDAPEASMLPVISQILLVTQTVIQEKLSYEEAVGINSVILPVFTHAMEFASTEEVQLHIRHITNELGNARSVLERLEKTKSDFISVAAHELKTPLTLIEGYVSMLRDALPSEEAKKAQALLYLKGVNAGTKRLREIVDDMIDVSLIDNDMLSLNFQPVWLNHLLETIQHELMDTIRMRGLKFTVKQFPGCDEMIFGDGERLFQALKNVVTNAIKYTPDGGSITIDGRLLPGFIEMTITDTGIGIDPDDHARIFEKFGRLGNVSLHSSGKTKFKGGGPGLGLPITKGIIDAHEGTIWVESDGYDEVNCPGSVFHIMMPIRKTPPDDRTAKLFRGLIDQPRFR